MQSVMCSVLLYEDTVADCKLINMFNLKVILEEISDGHLAWVLELKAKVEEVAYQKRKIWIGQERYISLKEELFAKSGQLLKTTMMSDVVKIQGRWFPKKINYKDVLKDGDGTDFVIVAIEFNVEIPEYTFNKASLKK